MIDKKAISLVVPRVLATNSLKPKNMPVLFTILLSVVFSAPPRSLFADEAQFVGFPVPKEITVNVDLRQPLEPVNRRVMGVCLIFLPFSDKFTESLVPILDGTSGRAWMGHFSNQGWGYGLGSARLAHTVGMTEINGFNPKDHINHPAHYLSPSDNNLPEELQPEAVARHVKRLNTEPASGLPHGAGLTGWEVWNEPQFPHSGAWPAIDFARYALDVSDAFRKAGLRIDVGVPLHEDDNEWNRRMLSYIAASNPGAIQFVVTHPYDFSWIRTRSELGAYSAKLIAAEIIRKDRLTPKKKLVDELGNGRWRLIASEWNIHPEGYKPPFDVSTDMVAAMNMAAMFGVFWDENIDSAQFFHLRGNEDGHFHLFYQTDNGIHINPIGHVLSLYGRYFRGDRLATNIDSPSFHYDYKGTNVEVPVVFGQSAFNEKDGQLVISLVNRHHDEMAEVELSLTNFRPTRSVLKKITLGSVGTDLREGVLTEEEQPLPPGSDPKMTIDTPPHSVTFLIVEGKIPPSESELFAGRQHFIREWVIGDILDPIEGKSAQVRLEEETTGIELQKKTLTQANSTGFVNIANLLNVSGRGYNLREGFTATARCWVFSPVPRELQLSAGFDFWGNVRVNGEKVIDASQRRGPVLPDTHCGKAFFGAGWNEIRVRVYSGSKGMGFWLAIEATGDLIESPASKAVSNWPMDYVISASQGAGVNAWDKVRKVPNPDNQVIELSGGGIKRFGYLSWGSLEAPDDLSLVKAEVVLTPAYQKGGDDSKIMLAPVLQAWDEDTLCFDNQPPHKPALNVTANVSDANSWTLGGEDVTAMVREWLKNPSDNHGIFILSNVSEYAAFHSDESVENAPRLVLEFETSQQ